jgi:hypothetical protein
VDTSAADPEPGVGSGSGQQQAGLPEGVAASLVDAVAAQVRINDLGLATRAGAITPLLLDQVRIHAEFSASDHAPDRRDHWRYTWFRHDRLASALKLLLFAASPVPSFAPARDGLIDGGER